jgi:ComEC/Rec2-related protein
MVASLTLSLFILLYVIIFLFHPSLFIVVPILLMQASLYIVFAYKKRIILIFIIVQGMLFIPYVVKEDINKQQPDSMYGEITSLEGTAIFDSTLSESGNRVVSLRVMKAISSKGVILTLNRNIITIIRTQHSILAGSVIAVQGHFFLADDGNSLFMANSYELIKPPPFGSFREKILDNIKMRITCLSEKNQQLVLLVALGMKGENSSYITNLAIYKGVAHLFALSGMHLSVILSLFFLILSSCVSQQKSRIITLFIALCYLWIVGNKPSLMRSVLFLFVSVIPWIPSNIDRCLSVILLHSLLFPHSMMTLAAVYSYTAIFSIIMFTSFISKKLEFFLPTFLSSLSALTMSAMSATGSISVILFNTFVPIGCAYSYLLTPMIMLLLIISILYILLPINFLAYIVEYICLFTYRILEQEVAILSFSPLLLYVLFLCFILTLILFLCYSQKARQSRSILIYEMDISIRIKVPDKSTP